MKYVAYYLVRDTVTFDSDAPDDANLKSHALWYARNRAGRPDVELVQVLREGVKSELGNDNDGPRGPRGPTPPPDRGPLAPAGDQMTLRREAA